MVRKGNVRPCGCVVVDEDYGEVSVHCAEGQRLADANSQERTWESWVALMAHYGWSADE